VDVTGLHRSSCRGYELLGVFLRESCGSNFAGDGLGVVCDALDRDLGLTLRWTQNRERSARVAVLRLA
jgi:hypothetical protein